MTVLDSIFYRIVILYYYRTILALLIGAYRDPQTDRKEREMTDGYLTTDNARQGSVFYRAARILAGVMLCFLVLALSGCSAKSITLSPFAETTEKRTHEKDVVEIELIEIDLFAEVFIEYEGVAPEARAILRNASNDAFLKNVSYRIDNGSYLSNGDIITVTASISAETAEANGYLINETEKVFTVAGIDEYVKSYDMLDDEAFDRMEKRARELVDAALADSLPQLYLYPEDIYTRTTNVEIQEVKLAHSYFFVLKDGIHSGYKTPNNRIALIYEVSFTSSRTAAGETDVVYLPVIFEDIIMRGDGTIDVVLTKAELSYKRSNVFENMYREVVTASKAKYDCEEIDY